MPIARVLPRVRGDLECFADSSGCQNDRRGAEGHETARLAPVAERARDSGLRGQEPGDRALHEYVNSLVYRMVLEGADHLESRSVPDVSKPCVTVAAKIPLEDPAVIRSVEEGTPPLQFMDPLRSFLGMDLCHPPVIHHLPAAHGVPEVDLPVVLRVHVAHSRRDATLRHHGVGLAQQRFADQCGTRSRGRCLDCRSESCAARTNHNDVVLVNLEICHQKNLGSLNTPLARSRT